MGIPDNRFRRHDHIGISKALYAGGNIDGLTEVVLPVVEIDCETWSLVDADFQEKIVAAVLGIQLKHRLAHPERGGHCAVRAREGRHDGVADCLDDRSGLRGNDLVKDPEVRSYQIECGKVTDALVERGRASQVSKEEGEAGDLEALVDVKCVGPIDVPETLVRQDTFRREKSSPATQQVV